MKRNSCSNKHTAVSDKAEIRRKLIQIEIKVSRFLAVTDQEIILKFSAEM